ncbi:protein arginine kinase [Clostridium fermenticellae]|uniref:Protein-arginine kinase n=1 Tax=Clostridium fermenticellae TaxID=2068654 RepID=A0A386H0Y2_9CLOT|nr:protein arginine kinase [Clostridium fermenticellae]AYD39225.1 protein arginine kinase [Clostridium fermenticellae]
MENWINSNRTENKLVLSSRIRLARNIGAVPFPHMLNEEKGKEIVNLVEDAFYKSQIMKDKFTTKYLWESDPASNRVFFDKHLISKNLLDNSSKGAFILDDDETTSIMINEEDHIRIQCITAGFNLEGAYDYSDKIDDLLEQNLNYAFDEKLGYLTACPTNIGTGLRASVMIHLPALSISNKIAGILNAISQVGMTIRGLYGEGSKIYGNIYQISNQISLGLDEREIINNLSGVVNQIINEEVIARDTIFKTYKYNIEDRIYRALGILKSAVLLNSDECLRFLSDVRLGVEMGIIKDVDLIMLNKLLVKTQCLLINDSKLQNSTEEKKSFDRAKMVRETLIKK